MGYRLIKDTNSNTIRFYLRDNKVPKTKRVLLERLLDYRRLDKACTSFGANIVYSVDPDGRIRGNFNQLLATGRMSAMKPALQQIPHQAEQRSCFIPTKGWRLVGSDYNSQELVIIATGAKEESWLQTVKEGKDLHSKSAEVIFRQRWVDAAMPDCAYYQSGKKCNCDGHKELREMAKTMSFGLSYGLTPSTFALRMGLEEEEAEELYGTYFHNFSKVKQWLTANALTCQRKSEIFTFKPFHRWRDVHGQRMYRKGNIGKNTPVQGTGGDMMKLAAVYLYDYILEHDVPARILLLVHDEILTECKPEYEAEWKPIVKLYMEKAASVILKHDLLKAEPVGSDCWTKN